MLKSLVALTIGAGLVVCSFANAQDTWEAGKNYFVIEPPQATSTGDKIEVVEVFSYACPHCNEVVPMVQGLKSRLPANAEFVMLPAQFGFSAWQTFAKGFYTAQALGLVEKTHEDLFRTIYVDKSLDSRSPTFAAIADFYAKYGVTAEDFIATSNSFAVKARLKRNEELIKAYGVDGTPTFVVNGKYRVTSQSSDGYKSVESIVHYLIEKESKGK